MSYRSEPTQVPLAKKKLIACDVAPSIEIHVLNGTSSEVTIPCRYVVDGQLVPIILTDEGYSDPTLALDRSVTGLEWESSIDPVDKSVIKLIITADCPGAVDKDIPLDFSLLITRTMPDATTRNDSVIHGRLLIVAAPFIGGVQE